MLHSEVTLGMDIHYGIAEDHYLAEWERRVEIFDESDIMEMPEHFD